MRTSLNKLTELILSIIVSLMGLIIMGVPTWVMVFGSWLNAPRIVSIWALPAPWWIRAFPFVLGGTAVIFPWLLKGQRPLITVSEDYIHELRSQLPNGRQLQWAADTLRAIVRNTDDGIIDPCPYPTHLKGSLIPLGDVLSQCLWMLDKVDFFLEKKQLSKAERWINFVMGTLVTYGIVSIDQCRDLNRPLVLKS